MLSRGDFVRYTDVLVDDSNNQIGRVDYMFIYKSSPSKLRLFFRITPAYPMPYSVEGQLTDSISECKIRKIVSIAEQIIVGLLAISGKRVYTVLYKNHVG